MGDPLRHHQRLESQNCPLISSLPPEIILRVFRLLVTYYNERWVHYLKKDQLLYGDAFETEEERLAHYAPSPGPMEVALRCEISEESISWHAYPAPYGLVQLTHVCRSWRELALSTSTLWTHIAVLGAEATAEMLRRSKGQPLTVSMNYREDRVDLLRDIFRDHTGRITTAIIPAISTLITASNARDALQLDTLIIVGPSLLQGDEILDLPLAGNPLDFPVLEHVQVSTLLCGSFVHLFPRTLRTLKLRSPRGYGVSVSDEENSLITSRQLAYALIHTPLLEVLHADLHDETEDIPLVVPLPKLREISLCGASHSLRDLFRALNVPRNTVIDLDCRFSSDLELYGVPPVREILQGIVAACLVSSEVGNPKFEPALSFAIALHGSYYQICGWRSVQVLQAECDDSPPDVMLTMPNTASMAEAISLLSNMHFHGVHSMRFGRLPWDPDSINQLRLIGISFGDSDNVEQVGNPYPSSDGTVQDFANACAARRQRFEELYFDNVTNFLTDDLSKIQSLEHKVYWNGQILNANSELGVDMYRRDD